MTDRALGMINNKRRQNLIEHEVGTLFCQRAFGLERRRRGADEPAAECPQLVEGHMLALNKRASFKTAEIPQCSGLPPHPDDAILWVEHKRRDICAVSSF